MEGMDLRLLGSLFHSVIPGTDQAACPNVDDLNFAARLERACVLRVWLFVECAYTASESCLPL